MSLRLVLPLLVGAKGKVDIAERLDYVGAKIR